MINPRNKAIYFDKWSPRILANQTSPRLKVLGQLMVTISCVLKGCLWYKVKVMNIVLNMFTFQQHIQKFKRRYSMSRSDSTTPLQQCDQCVLGYAVRDGGHNTRTWSKLLKGKLVITYDSSEDWLVCMVISSNYDVSIVMQIVDGTLDRPIWPIWHGVLLFRIDYWNFDIWFITPHHRGHTKHTLNII